MKAMAVCPRCYGLVEDPTSHQRYGAGRTIVYDCPPAPAPTFPTCPHCGEAVDGEREHWAFMRFPTVDGTGGAAAGWTCGAVWTCEQTPAHPPVTINSQSYTEDNTMTINQLRTRMDRVNTAHDNVVSVTRNVREGVTGHAQLADDRRYPHELAAALKDLAVAIDAYGRSEPPEPIVPESDVRELITLVGRYVPRTLTANLSKATVDLIRKACP